MDERYESAGRQPATGTAPGTGSGAGTAPGTAPGAGARAGTESAAGTDTAAASGSGGGTAAGRSRVVSWDDPMATAGAVHGRSGLEFMRALATGAIPPPPIVHALGMRLESVAEGEVVFSLEPAEFHYNTIGSVHGGVYATLLDSSAGCAVQTRLPAGTGYTSLDLSVKFLGAIRLGQGKLLCTGTVTHLGRRTALAEARIVTPQGRLLATATSSCLLLTL